ncbi:serine/threonine-protein kinase [Streptomyces guryensis]|uniref:non-specific serine/threonine protein kinase n=1 Tax=Streptomyces guryensis TaxID=2886947 RepID=A0A9Q3ZAJ9_9ACTN|nr:serine/threonine-protein kinase [Streptomyces guryensis]MCD9880948.1 protein kinase [Streptomyces guryensis]
MNQSPADPSPPRLLAGRYRLVEQLGHGGMGTVWRAHDELLDREVAVKEVRVSGLSPEERSVLHARMQQEARAAARIKHPGVVTVFDVLQEGDSPWIVMELIDGQSLEDILITEGTLLPRDAARFGAAVLAALDKAHQLGILHRDVKPANVLLERSGRIVLTDFGIALFENSPGLTRTGDIVGSPDYLAPERATGHRPGPPSDLWSLGATLYAAVEGQSPFRRSSTLSTLQAVISDPLPEPRHAGSLAFVIEALLRKDPEARPTASQAQRMLEEVAAGAAAPQAAHPATEVIPPQGASPTAEAPAGQSATPLESTPLPPNHEDTASAVTYLPPEPPRTQPGRRIRLLVVLAVVLVTVLIGGLVWALTSRTGTPPAPQSKASAVTDTPSSLPTRQSPSRTSTSASSPPTSASSLPTPASSPPTPASSVPSLPPAASGPGAVVTAYFDALNAGDYKHAWELGGKNLQRGSYESFRNSFEGTADESATITSVTGDSVGINLDATQTDGTHRYFSGTYTVRNGAIVAADIHVSG